MVNTIIETSTVHPGTPGETPLSVVMTPKTIQGWRPISVKIQPTSEAIIGIGAVQMAIFQAQAGTVRSLRVSQSPTTETSVARARDRSSTGTPSR